MDIFGITLTETQIWLLGAAGGAIGLFVAIRAPLLQSKLQRKADAAADFRATFTDLILNLRENSDLPSAQIAGIGYHAILAGAQQFRPWVYWWRRSSFDRAVLQYKDACKVATENGSILAIAASEKTDFAKAKRKVLDNAVQHLYSFAKPT
jgi:hypothetical protein